MVMMYLVGVFYFYLNCDSYGNLLDIKSNFLNKCTNSKRAATDAPSRSIPKGVFCTYSLDLQQTGADRINKALNILW